MQAMFKRAPSMQPLSIVAFPPVGPAPASASLRFGERTAPKDVAIVDFFERRHPDAKAVVEDPIETDVDIDGDGVNDLPHGTVIERLMSGLSHQPLRFHEFPLPQVHDFREPWLDFARGMRDQCRALEAAVAKGQHFDAVNISQAFNGSFAGTRLREHLAFNAENAHLLAGDLLAFLKESEDPYYQTLADTLESLQRLGAQGVKIYIGAGNEGPEKYNLLNLAGNIIGVGANYSDAQAPASPYLLGGGATKAHYSADNSLLQRFSKGSYAVTRVQGGYDLTGDGKADIREEEVSGGASVRAALNGQPASGAPGVHAIMPLMMQAMSGQTGLNADALAKLASLGDFVSLEGEARVYKTDGDGRLIWNGDDSGRENPVNVLNGTSLAAPTALVEDLNSEI